MLLPLSITDPLKGWDIRGGCSMALCKNLKCNLRYSHSSMFISHSQHLESLSGHLFFSLHAAFFPSCFLSSLLLYISWIVSSPSTSCLLRFFSFLFFLRKISPELTSAANTPLFAEEDWSWASICAHLPLLYMWDACHSMAWQAVPSPHLGSEQVNPRLPKRNVWT